jgi:hypothetical protein
VREHEEKVKLAQDTVQGPVADSGEHGNEISGSIQGGSGVVVQWLTPGSDLGRRPAILSEISRSFSHSLQANAGTVLKLGHDRFLPYPFQLITHLSSFHSTLHSLCYWESTVK